MANQAESVRGTADTILDAAIELFISAGFETTPMDAIAAAAGVAKGTLYYHFKSKEGIVEAIVERYIVSVEKTFSAIETDETRGPLEKLTAITDAMKDINMATFSKLHRMKYIDIHEKTTTAVVERFAPCYARIIEEGNESGLWKADHPLEFAEISIAASSFLFDPERGTDRIEKRLAAFIDITAKVLGIEPGILAPAFKSLSAY
jgi:AcrR family transcriptional regulator